jgi:hypothetical protein
MEQPVLIMRSVIFNNNQFFGSTAILFGFKNKMQVGPQLQYAFTNLLKSSMGNPKHLRSINQKEY